MSERIERLRQVAHEEALEREGRFAVARQMTASVRGSKRGPAPVPYGDKPCPRCGTRTSIGCKHVRPS